MATHRKERTARLNLCAEVGGEAAEGVGGTSFRGVTAAVGGEGTGGGAPELHPSPWREEGGWVTATGGFLLKKGTYFDNFFSTWYSDTVEKPPAKDCISKIKLYVQNPVEPYRY